MDFNYCSVIVIQILAQYVFDGLAQMVVTEAFVPEEMDCPGFEDTIVTQNVPWGDPFRAYKTCPPEVTIAPSTIPKAGYGVIATTFIKKYTWLGEYEGEVIPISRVNDISWYAWTVHRGGNESHFVDAYNIQTSSYLRWINCARNNVEENVVVLECLGRILYMTSKDIKPGQELLVYYGDEYAKELNIKLNLY